MEKAGDLVARLVTLGQQNPSETPTSSAERQVDEFLLAYMTDMNAVRAVVVELDVELDRAVAAHPELEAYLTALKVYVGKQHPEGP